MPNNPVTAKRLTIISSVCVIIIICCCVCFFWCRSTTVVLVIRHAEKNNAAACTPAAVHGHANPPLSLTGGESPRAQALVHVCGEDGITAIYASEYCRTQLTVQPLASHLGIPVRIVDQFAADASVNISALVDSVWAHNRGKVVLIAGHTNTIPSIIERLSGITIDPIPETDYDDLYVVTLPRWFGRPKVIRLQYGEPS